ncbi:MAG: NAD-dependent epimerase/dehydratase family protein [Kineosporiaceae bacterium]
MSHTTLGARVVPAQGLHVVVGAGPVGRAVTRTLTTHGRTVRVLTRTGAPSSDPLVEAVAVDASDPAAFLQASTGAVAIYNCVNPPYHRWAQLWPPVAGSLLAAAQAHGAVLAIVGNLYAYGPVEGPMTEDHPLAATGVKGRVRADMWREALAAHEAGRVRVTEARGSDYLGHDSMSQLGAHVLTAMRKGRTAWVLGEPDAPHTWTFTEDMARTVVTAAADPAGWGRAWHVPSHAALPSRQVVEELARLDGAPSPKVRRMPWGLVRALGVAVPFLREMPEVIHQHVRPWVMDSSAAQRQWGLAPTPWEEILRDHLRTGVDAPAQHDAAVPPA